MNVPDYDEGVVYQILKSVAHEEKEKYDYVNAIITFILSLFGLIFNLKISFSGEMIYYIVVSCIGIVFVLFYFCCMNQ